MDPAVALLRDLVAINSINPTLVPGAPGEREIAEAVAGALRRIGLDVEMQDASPGRPNVVGILSGRRPGRTLMLCGHTDTVGVTGMRAPFDPVEKDGRLYGRGAQDMKAGVAAMIDAARALVARGGLDQGRLVIAAVVDEEHSSIGADALVAKYSADAAVVTEPTDLAVAIAHKGFAWLDVTVLGRAAHGSRPAEGQDAILRLGRVLVRLEALDRALQAREPHPLVGTASLHASLIAGGTELSTYPDRAVLQMERRTLPSESQTDALNEVERILNDLAADDPTFNGSVRLAFGRPAYELPAADPFVQLVRATAAQHGAPATLTGAGFWADSAVLGHAGIPSVLFGPGGAGLHSTEEYVNVADVVLCRDALAELARRFC
jgi:acetylornithine deacetylase